MQTTTFKSETPEAEFESATREKPTTTTPNRTTGNNVIAWPAATGAAEWARHAAAANGFGGAFIV
jgi:hypothetical protein